MKLLIVGCGSIGRRYALSVARLGVPFAVMDISRDRSIGIAKETGTDTYFEDLDQALAWGPEAVVVATPNRYHAEHATAALAAGAHVLIEKPISDRLVEADRLVKVAEQANRRAFVVCNMRFHPAVKALKSGMGAIGEVRYARAHYGNYLPLMRPGGDYRELYCSSRAAGGGVVLDAIHEIDYLIWLLGPVNAVQGASGKLSDLDIDVEDFANFTMEHVSGARSVVTIDYLRPWKRRGCELVGSEGLIVWESEGKQPEQCSVRVYESAKGAWRSLLATDNLDNETPYVDMLAAFLDATRGKATWLQTVREARDRLSVALRAREGRASPIMMEQA